MTAEYIDYKLDPRDDRGLDCPRCNGHGSQYNDGPDGCAECGGSGTIAAPTAAEIAERRAQTRYDERGGK